jgi:hypothetical protein
MVTSTIIPSCVCLQNSKKAMKVGRGGRHQDFGLGEKLEYSMSGDPKTLNIDLGLGLN